VTLALLSIVIGLIAGAMSGMFGIGGGVVMVPLLLYLLRFEQHRAQGTSLAVLCVPVAALGVLNYWKAGNIDLRAAGFIAVGFLVGGYLGSRLSLGLDQGLVRKLFAALLMVLALQLFFKKDAPDISDLASETRPSAASPKA